MKSLNREGYKLLINEKIVIFLNNCFSNLHLSKEVDKNFKLWFSLKRSINFKK